MEEFPHHELSMENNENKRIFDTPVAGQGLASKKMLSHLQHHPETPGLVESYQAVVALANHVAAKGGRAFLVGGGVRDELLGVVPKDFDIEVHGLEVTEVEALLQQFGRVELTGKSFGTYKLPASIGQVEVALPRRDSQYGDKHNQNKPVLLPTLGLAEAPRRRDFTIGAISKDILTGELYDPFHGIDDLKEKTLRIVDANTFGDDALRVLRGAAHVSRFGLSVEPETRRVMGTMVEKIGALPEARLREEWSKILVKGDHPSLGIELLHDIGVLERWYPEVAQLWQTQQDSKFHPEGNVGKHTILVTDAAAAYTRSQKLSTNETTELMYAALLHDTGKPSTTKEIDGTIHAYGHEAAGVKPTETFLERLGISPIRISRITALVENHMRPPALYRERDHVTDRALRKLARDVGSNHLRALVLLGAADHRGRGPFEQVNGTMAFPDTTKYLAWWEEQIRRLSLDQAPTQILWGRDLVESDRNWKPGKLVGEAVRLAEELAVQGMTREAMLEIIDNANTPEAAITDLRQRVELDSE